MELFSEATRIRRLSNKAFKQGNSYVLDMKESKIVTLTDEQGKTQDVVVYRMYHCLDRKAVGWADEFSASSCFEKSNNNKLSGDIVLCESTVRNCSLLGCCFVGRSKVQNSETESKLSLHIENSDIDDCGFEKGKISIVNSEVLESEFSGNVKVESSHLSHDELSDSVSVVDCRLYETVLSGDGIFVGIGKKDKCKKFSIEVNGKTIETTLDELYSYESERQRNKIFQLGITQGGRVRPRVYIKMEDLFTDICYAKVEERQRREIMMEEANKRLMEQYPGKTIEEICEERRKRRARERKEKLENQPNYQSYKETTKKKDLVLKY